MKFEMEMSREKEEKVIQTMKDLVEQKDRELDDLRRQLENRAGLQNPGSLNSLTDLLNDEELGKTPSSNLMLVVCSTNPKYIVIYYVVITLPTN